MIRSAAPNLFGLVLLAACTINVQVNSPPTQPKAPTESAAAASPIGIITNVGPTESAATAAPVNTTTLENVAPPPASVTASVPQTGSSGPVIANCAIFPPDHIWNTRVDILPVHPHSDAYIDSIGRDIGLHPDFGSGLWEGGPIGIPFVVADGSTPRAAVSFEYADESDPGPYPIPSNPPIEGGSDSDGDRHILIVESSECKLYELYAAYPNDDGSWQAGSGAIWDLSGYGLRPDEWTSADAAGLPILPGLVRYDEVAAGEIRHAIRFTAEVTQRAYIWPARHFASEVTDPSVPPMGQRFRLKASFDLSPYPREVQIILRAMQVYGLILADNGSSWYISGAPDERWNNDELVPLLREVTGDDFEAVDVSGLRIDPNSGQARQP
jgi:hypothetical protein